MFKAVLFDLDNTLLDFWLIGNSLNFCVASSHISPAELEIQSGKNLHFVQL